MVVSGNAHAGRKLLGGEAFIEGDTRVQGTLAITKSVELLSDIRVRGNSVMQNATAHGDIDILGTMMVSKKTMLSDASVLNKFDVAGRTELSTTVIGESLEVRGAANMKSTLDVSDHMNCEMKADFGDVVCFHNGESS